MKKLLLIIVLITLCVLSINAQNYYVRDGASGNNSGTDWANAYTELPTTLIRGASYYIADGNYPGYTFDDATDGEQYIYINKATVNDHGTNTGWNDSYGAGQAVFTHSIQFETGYWVWDGITGNKNNESSYGFKIVVKEGSESNSHQQLIRLINTENALHNIEIRHTTMENSGIDYPSAQSCIYSPGSCVNSIIADNYMYNPQYAMLIRSWNNCIIESNYFGPNWSNADYHGGSISTSGDTEITVRNNIFEGIVGSGVIHVVTGLSNDWDIYGNIFVNGGTGRPTISAGGSHAFSDLRIYNNTFINHYHAGVHGSNGSNNIAFNNIFYNCTSMYIAVCDHYYNWYYGSGDLWDPEDNHQVGSGDPFIDYVNGNYQLAAATDPGMTISGFNYIDPSGITRGSDGIIDRGAYEYTTATAINIDPTKETRILQNYPNPFKINTSIVYSLPENSDVEISLYDVTGRKIQTLFEGHQIAGEHTLDVELNTIEAGVFFFKLEAGTYKAVSKCTVTQ